ncbi:MAG: hypothetical protein IPP14_11565 [Planctomycetes bacterium]|nr:hypothetical protein [Planctomycetota bacterium]
MDETTALATLLSNAPLPAALLIIGGLLSRVVKAAWRENVQPLIDKLLTHRDRALAIAERAATAAEAQAVAQTAHTAAMAQGGANIAELAAAIRENTKARPTDN